MIALLLFGVLAAATAQTKPPDGTIVENSPCAVPAKRTYEQYLKEQKASLEEASRHVMTVRDLECFPLPSQS